MSYDKSLRNAGNTKANLNFARSKTVATAAKPHKAWIKRWLFGECNR